MPLAFRNSLLHKAETWCGEEGQVGRFQCGASALAIISVSAWMTAAPATAFEDEDFCTTAKQLAAAAEGDVGVWLDRRTRNAGIRVACDRKLVEFLRFTYSPSSAMDGAWKAAKAAEWNGMQCASPLWADAIGNDWKVALSVTAADGGNVVLHAKCK